MEEERPYEASRIKELVRQEIKRIEATHDSEGSDWTTKVIQGAYRFIDVANGLKPVIDIFVPHSPEYSVPYACVWIIFKVSPCPLCSISSAPIVYLPLCKYRTPVSQR
jgi:hypothetical protein